MDTNNIYDVIIIGAGAAGVGLGVLFEKMGINNYLILEKDTVGSSFKAWSAHTRFISPSFTGNAFGVVDLNAVTPDTSPAHTLKTEHPTGTEYASYLGATADHFNLKVAEGADVTSVSKDGDLFAVEASGVTFSAKQLVWAGGEFKQPATPDIPGADLCMHSSAVQNIDDEHITVIGGYESGMDLAKEALDSGKSVTVIDAGAPWDIQASDSSISLSPYTKDRLRPYIGSENFTVITNTRITKIAKDDGGYLLHSDTAEPIRSATQPILATGFENLPPVIAPLFTETETGHVALTEDDESTLTPGCFLVGPKVQHGEIIFCFIYKFRQRIPVVAETIAENLALDLELPFGYSQPGMYLGDISRCGDECAC